MIPIFMLFCPVALLTRLNIVICETGTPVFGLLDIPLPRSCQCSIQAQWLSLGRASGAVLDAAVAASQKSPPRRTILFAGDGGLRLVRPHSRPTADIHTKT